MTWLVDILGVDFWRQWWFWGAVAALFGILELIVPGFIFVGFAIGAAVLSAAFLVGPPVSDLLPTGLPALVLVFAVLSVFAWIALRRLLGVRHGQVKTYRHDINED